MKRLSSLTFVLALAAMTSLAACGSSGNESNDGTGNASTFPSSPLLTVTSDTGALHVDLRTSPTQPPVRGEQSVELVIADATSGAPKSGLALAVVPWMPAMGHGASVTPSVTETTPGTYVISNVDLFMSGTWELRTTISGSLTDTFAPSFEIE